MLENKSRTDLSALGEFGLIRHLTQHLVPKNASSFKGVGDDAAVIDLGGENVALISTDMLTEGVHFDLTYVPLKHLGYKAATVNFSDIAAMNGTPKQLLVSMGMSSRFPLEAVEELYAGIVLACEKYGVDIIGGDTVSSRIGLTLSMTVIGEAKKENIVYRNGARDKDLICVTGDLGGAYAGLLLLEREKAVFKDHPTAQPDLEGNDYILERQLKPEARVDVVKSLELLGVKPTSMIDISDGLASELHHLCSQSGTGCHIYEEKIPLDPMTIERAQAFNLDTTMCAMNGGEDYELLFTISQNDFEKVKNNPDISIIGYMTAPEGGLQLVSRDNSQHPITAQGWNAFTESKEAENN